MDCFASLAMTERHTFAFPRHDLPGVCHLVVPPSEERAQGKPGADCARITVCKKLQTTHTGLTGTAETSRLSPRNGFTVSFVLSPVSGLYCHRCRPRTGGADRRQGRGARTTRLRRTLPRFRPAGKTRLTPQRPSQP